MSIFKSTILGFALISSIATNFAQADEWQTTLGLSLGSLNMDKASWSGEDNFGAIALNLDLTKQAWPFGLSASIFSAGDEKKIGSTKTENVVGGLQLGIKKSIPTFCDELEPFVSGGVYYAVAQKSIKTGDTTRKESDNDVSYFASTGALWHLSSHVNIGIEFRYTEVDVNIFNEDLDGGGLFSAISLSYSL